MALSQPTAGNQPLEKQLLKPLVYIPRTLLVSVDHSLATVCLRSASAKNSCSTSVYCFVCRRWCAQCGESNLCMHTGTFLHRSSAAKASTWKEGMSKSAGEHKSKCGTWQELIIASETRGSLCPANGRASRATAASDNPTTKPAANSGVP